MAPPLDSSASTAAPVLGRRVDAPASVPLRQGEPAVPAGAPVDVTAASAQGEGRSPEDLLAAIEARGEQIARLAPPRHAAGVELLGRLAGAGHRNPPGLVRRRDGQTLQLTPLLYDVMAGLAEAPTYGDAAEAISARSGRAVTAGDVCFLTEMRLRPLGILARDDGAEPAGTTANPLLALRWKVVVSSPALTRRLTDPFTWLFRPAVVALVVTAFTWLVAWLGFSKGLGSATHQALHQPGLLLLVFALTILSAGFHEFGHAAACRYGGAQPGVMGAGLYLVWPAFYTDVSDSYRLSKAGRLRVDLGGLYFNAVCALVIFGVWALVEWDALLLVVGAQVLQMARQLIPLVRFDGYHILADLTGVPDLFAQIRPTLRRLRPWRRHELPPSPLRPWARAVVTAWVLVVVPALLGLLVVMVRVLPRLAATAWESAGVHVGYLQDNLAAGDLARVGVGVLALCSLALPVLAISYLLVRVTRRVARAAWRWASAAGTPWARGGVAFAGALLIVGVGLLWWSDGGTPIGPDERGTLPDAFFGVLAADEVDEDDEPAAAAPLRAADVTPLRAAQTLQHRPAGAAGPTGSATALPAAQAGGHGAQATAPSVGPSPDRVANATTPAPVGGGGGQTTPAAPPTQTGSSWPFPFPQPIASGPDDNRAYIWNDRDGTARHDVALSLVQTDRSPVRHRNEAWALASCDDCRAVAVAFQVVLITSTEVNVTVPVNQAVAVNHECEECVVHALATQIVATVDGPVRGTDLARLQRALASLQPLRGQASRRPIEQIHAELQAAKAEVLAVVTAIAPDAVIVERDSEALAEEPAAPELALVEADADASTDDELEGRGADEPALSSDPPADAPAAAPDDVDASEAVEVPPAPVVPSSEDAATASSDEGASAGSADPIASGQPPEAPPHAPEPAAPDPLADEGHDAAADADEMASTPPVGEGGPTSP